ncbi:FAD-dependent oxidoreductase [Actinoplanes solisilvae]|uniref:FAD-dependent oxidoreductase n=1 Tax=Actinoplanes solisilvae TaxID=2486853 RepID=UPI000FD8A347|nr:squalene monooxygenase [Actinoplanes solisilvae]
MAEKGLGIVIGASVTGVLAAAALRNSYATVRVVDRDTIPSLAASRRNVPQANHAHGLLAGGLLAMEDLLPGITKELIAAGALTADLQNDLHWYLNGQRLAPAREPSGIDGLAVSRVLLEHLIRVHVGGIDGISVVDRQAVSGLITHDRRVVGVSVVSPEGAETRLEGADLVIDATGRGSRSGAWLQSMGCPPVETERLDVGIAYVSQRFRRESRFLNGRIGTLCAAYPGHLYGGFVTAEEDDRFIVSLTGRFGTTPPTDRAGMIAWAQRLATDDIAEIIRDAQPLGSPTLTRFPYSVRRHYEDLPGFPSGYAVLGDALCSFNPVYAQGMSVAALQAQLLGNLVAAGLPNDIQAGAAALTDVAWEIATGPDKTMITKRSRSAQNDEPTDQLLAAAVRDPALATAFLRVTNLIDPPESLGDPELTRRVVAAYGSSSVKVRFGGREERVSTLRSRA